MRLVTVGAEKPPILRRDSFDLVISQRGRYRPHVIQRCCACPAALRRSPGDHSEGSILVPNIATTIPLKKESGDVQVEGGDGAVTVEAGEGDVWFRGRSGAIAHHSGSGDVRLERCDGPVAINLGKGDVHARECQRALVVRTGSETCDWPTAPVTSSSRVARGM